MALSLDGYLWAVCSLVTEKIQIMCVIETYIKVITPPLAIIHMDSGCEGYSGMTAWTEFFIALIPSIKT